MNKSILQNGDLLFMSDESDLSKAIIETTEKYSHVGIYFDGMLYHASRKRGIAKQKLEEYLAEEKHEVFIYRYPEIDAEIIKERAERYLGAANTIIPSTLTTESFTVLSTSQKSYRFLILSQ